MWALDERFIRHYAPSGDKALRESISCSHLVALYAALVEAYELGTPAQRILLVSVLPPALCVAAGIAPDAIIRQAAEVGRTRRGWCLTMDEAIALIDYLHPQTMSFHVHNTGLRLKAYWGMAEVAEACDAFASAFHSALTKLASDPAFSNRDGLYYKGIEARGAYLPNQWLLNSLSAHQGELLSPHPVSATRLPMQSFAAISGRPEDSEVLIKVAEAVDVSAFHGRSGKDLGEVIILPRPLRVAGWQAIERRGRRFRQWQLEDAPQSLRLRLRKR